MKRYRTAAIVMSIIMTLALVPIPSMAMHALSVPSPKSMEKVPFGLPEDIFAAISAHVGFTFLGGEANELVYRESGSSDNLSKLIWELEGITMIGGVVSVQTPLLRDLRFTCGLWLSSSEGSGKMTDYDWMYEGMDWSDRSISDVSVVRGTMFDLNMSAEVFEIKSVALRGMVGLKTDYWSWEDFGGTYIYSRGGGFRNDVGTFPDGTGIEYEQLFLIPYAGVLVEGSFDSLGVSGYFTFSSLGYAEDKDFHVLRDIHFEETFDQVDYMGIGAIASWALGNHFYAIAGLEYQAMPTARGDSSVAETGREGTDDSGIDNAVTTFSLSIGAQL